MIICGIDGKRWYSLNDKKIHRLKKCVCINCGKVRYVQKLRDYCVKCKNKRNGLLRDQQGKKNPNWKGNKAKKRSGNARALRLYPKLDKCNYCCSDADVRHHIDTNTTNNVKTNILELCHKCHNKIHYLKRDAKGRFKRRAETF
ncbi:hypothetical protein LCGC14_1256220 [marine sediment metagenome]|uniref:HNH nuclease domain-containing protein n=1 Tax=marine sediment metagenome TaxID=412755 RepID=A0A0F9NIM8_9ZZZZ